MNNNKTNSPKHNGSSKSKNDSTKGKNDKVDEQFHWKKAGKTSLVWVLIIISAIFMSNLFTGQGRDGDGTRKLEFTVRDNEDLRVGIEESKRERVGLSRRAATY